MLIDRVAKLRKRLSAGEWLPIVSSTQSDKTAVLSFDDGPSPHTTDQILGILQDHNAVATFFFCGERAAAFPQLVERAARCGHAIYPHGYDHTRMDELESREFIDTLEKAEAVFRQHRPTPSPYYVRLPYAAGHGSRRIHRLIRRWKPEAEILHWGYSLHDWTLADDCSSLDQLAIRCEDEAQRAVHGSGFTGSVVLLHEDPLDVSAPLKADIAPLLLQALLRHMKAAGITTSPQPVNRPSRLSAFVRPALVKA